MALNLVYLAIIAALGSALLPILFYRSIPASKFVAFSLLGISGLSGILGGGIALLDNVDISQELPIGLPWLHCHLHLDPLSGFFLVLVS
ncbi:MAG: hydrogenase 4 subunit B, partial [Desulfuromusa sp.]